MDQLTERERQVLILLASGKSIKEAAHDLGLSTHTIEHHNGTLMRKINARNRADVVVYACRNGFVPSKEVQS